MTLFLLACEDILSVTSQAPDQEEQDLAGSTGVHSHIAALFKLKPWSVSIALCTCSYVEDGDKLNGICQDYLSDFNATSKTPMDLIIFSYAVEHVARLARIFLLANGHALLVGLGGSGRQSLVR
jgi:P-loop containing dynein motor region D4